MTSNREKHIVLWGGWYGSHNIGDQALLLSITDLLANAVGNVRFTVLTDNPEHVNNYTRSESTCRIRALHNRRQLPEVLKSIASCDLFVFGGGTPFFDERKHLLAMALLVATARLFRTPYMTWTVSSHSVDSPAARRLFRWVLNGAAAITYRDQHTAQLFRDCNVTQPIHLAGDSAYWLAPDPDEKALEIIRRAAGDRFATGRPLVALTPRTLRGRDGDAETHYSAKTPQEYQLELDCFAAALDWLWENGYQPIFLSMNTVAPDDDRLAARSIMQQARYGSQAWLINEDVRPRSAAPVYRQCLASFVARVHGSINSMNALTPVMMYAFAAKHAGIMQAMDLSEFSLLESQASPNSTLALLAGLLERRLEVQQAMARRYQALRAESMIPVQLALKALGNAHSDR